ncbi:hypothetical protein CF319_g7818 [Tilletia indica]|nr:hypothetical protein CF319_g7818 [Tilletia indica]
MSSRRTKGGTSTTSSTTASSSLTSSFASLTPHDIHFFNTLIASLPQSAADFASLKHAYESALSRSQEQPQRWDTLLRLVQVRGRTWHERWHAVRMALGLTSSSSNSDTSSSTEHSDTRRRGDQHNHSPSAGSDADSDSSPPHPPIPTSVSRVHFASPSTTPTPTPTQRTLDTLAARAGSLALAAAASASSIPSASRSAKQKYKARVVDEEEEEEEDDDLFAEDDDDGFPRIRAAQRQTPTTPRSHTPAPTPASTSSRRTTSGKAVLADLIRAVQQISLSSVQPPPPPPQPTLRSSHADLSRDEEDEGETLIMPPSLATRLDRQQKPLSHPHLSAHQAHIQSVVQRARKERDLIRRRPPVTSESDVEGGTGEMELAAEEWSRKVLTVKALSWWVTLTRRSTSRQTHVAQIHAVLSLRRTFSHWLNLTRLRRVEEDRAGRIDEVRVLLGGWNTWMGRVRKRWEGKREERRTEIRGAFKGVVELRSQNAQKGFFKIWKERYDTRLADAVRREHLQRGALALWTLSHTKQSTLNSHLSTHLHSKRTSTISSLFTLWKARVHEREWEVRSRRRTLESRWEWWKEAGRLKEMGEVLERHRLLQSSLSTWMRAHTLQLHLQRAESIALRWKARSLKRRVLVGWREKLAKLREREEVGVRVRVELDIRHLQGYVLLWTLKEREKLVQRVTEGRRTSSFWTTWRTKLKEVEGRYALQEGMVRERERMGRLRDVFGKLKDAFGLHVALENAAEGLARKMSVQRAFSSWRTLQGRKASLRAKAEGRDGAVLLDGAWSTWVQRRRERKIEEYERGKKVGLLKSSFGAWQTRAALKTTNRLALIRARTHDAERTQSHFLSLWTSRIISVRNAYYDAGVKADGKLRGSAWRKWKEVVVSHGEMLGLVEVFREVKEQERMARSFDVWFERAYDSMDRKARFDEFVEEREGRILREAWDSWVDRRVDTSLRSLEYQAVLIRKQAVMKRAFSRWKQSTQTLPAISFNLSKIKLRTLERWLDALPRAQSARLAIRLERENVLPRFWDAWVAAAKIERNLRAAERFGGISMRKFKSVSGRVRIMGGASPAAAAAAAAHGSLVAVHPYRTGGGGGGEGLRVGSPISTSSRRRWSLGPPRHDEDDDEEEE